MQNYSRFKVWIHSKFNTLTKPKMTFYSSEQFDADVLNYEGDNYNPILPNLPYPAKAEYTKECDDANTPRILPSYYDPVNNSKWEPLLEPSTTEPPTERLKVDLPILTNITKSERKHPVFHFTLNSEVYIMDRRHASTYTLSLKCVNQTCSADWKIRPNPKIIIYKDEYRTRRRGKKKRIQLDRSNPWTFELR